MHDFPEGSEHRLHMTKSKSMPEYGDSNVTGTVAYIILILYFNIKYLTVLLLLVIYMIWLC